MRLINADEIQWKGRPNDCGEFYPDDPQNYVEKRVIDGMPTVDAVKVVRCENCIYYHPDKERPYCNPMYGPMTERMPWDFCSSGMTEETLRKIETLVDQGAFDRVTIVPSETLRSILNKKEK